MQRFGRVALKSARTDQNLMGGRAMTDPSARMRPKQLCFDRYVLDLGRGCLLLDGIEVSLRPKTFAVLQYLIENSGRLVAKDELFAAVWPNLAVTDDALVQSMGELRRALGDDGPRLIRTIPRRGYRFKSAVTAITPIDPPVTDGPLAAGHYSAQSAEPVISARALTLLATALIGRRGALLVAVALVVLLAAVAQWSNLGSEWKSPAGHRSAESTRKNRKSRQQTRDRHSPLPEPKRRFGS